MTYELHLHNDILEIPLLGEWTEQICEKHDVTPAKMFQLNLALEEAVVNVMKYAFPDGRQHDILLTNNAEENAEGTTMTFKLVDNGVEFNPLQEKTPDITLPAEAREIGGLGIFLVQQMMENVEYKREDNKNILTMTFVP